MVGEYSLVGFDSDFPLFGTPYSISNGNGAGTIIERGGVMDRFPHRGFCEEQFLALMQTGTAFDLDILPNLADLWGWQLGDTGSATAKFRPEVWGIKPTQQAGAIGLSRQALLFTARLGKGRLLVCTFDVLENLKDKRPEADYLLHVLLEYALSDKFAPNGEANRESLPPSSTTKR